SASPCGRLRPHTRSPLASSPPIAFALDRFRFFAERAHEFLHRGRHVTLDRLGGGLRPPSETSPQHPFARAQPTLEHRLAHQIAFASSRSARTSSFTAVDTSPWMMRPGGRGGSASSPMTLSCGGSVRSPRSAALRSLISFFFAPMIPLSVGYRGS